MGGPCEVKQRCESLLGTSTPEETQHAWQHPRPGGVPDVAHAGPAVPQNHPIRHGWSISALARKFHLNRRTARRELAAGAPLGYPPRALRYPFTPAQWAHIDRRLAVCPRCLDDLGGVTREILTDRDTVFWNSATGTERSSRAS